MRAKVPGARSAHRETGEEDAVGIDGIIGLHRLDRLEDIDLAGVFPTDAVSAEGMEDDGPVLVLEKAAEGLALLAALVEEMQVGRFVAAPVQPDEEWHRLRQIEAFGDLESERLVGIVDRGTVTADDGTAFLQPRTLVALVEGLVADIGEIEHLRGEGQLLFGIELAVFQGEIDRLHQHRDIGDVVLLVNLPDAVGIGLDPLRESGKEIRGNRDAVLRRQHPRDRRDRLPGRVKGEGTGREEDSGKPVEPCLHQMRSSVTGSIQACTRPPFSSAL
jgi:hypothetical protein